jgi:alkanesulfonate monooxygenase SsuD/methylene tetrahydromethanopterin reductase-like flavin-dependent oxidoreductase (luciferase family)
MTPSSQFADPATAPLSSAPQPGRIKLGLVWMPRNIHEAIRIARTADRAGFDALGICDSPILWDEVYPVCTACLSATERVRLGPNVTNPVTRHWTIHAASLRANNSLAPGRAMLGIGPGDGAVFSIGLKPAGDETLASAVREIRAAAPNAGEIQVAAGGLRKARVAGQVGDAVILGTGLDEGALGNLAAAADEGALDTRAAGVRPERWGLAHINVVDGEKDLPAARIATRPLAIAYARHALSITSEGKNVPEEYREELSERLARYSFSTHSVPGAENPNGALLADRPELEDYVLERFALVGTPEECRARLERIALAAGLTGVWLIVVVPEPEELVDRVAAAFADLL